MQIYIIKKCYLESKMLKSNYKRGMIWLLVFILLYFSGGGLAML